MIDLKGRTEQEIMDAFIDKYKINIEEWEKLTLYLKGPKEETIKNFIEKWSIDIKEWNKMVNFLKNPSGELKIGDIVKFIHESRKLGIVNYIYMQYNSTYINVYSRDDRGVIKYLKEINKECLEKIT